MGTLFVIIILAITIYIVFDSSVVKKYSIIKAAKKRDDLVDLDDILYGYEYRANLWTPHTSLEALNHHGEIVRIVKETELPTYGNHGIWLPIISDDLQSKKPTETEFREFEFLKKFRTAFESNLAHNQKSEIISKLLNEYKEIPSQKLAVDWYLWDLREVPGISSSISNLLFLEGYKSKQDIENAPDEQLLKINGIGQSRLKQIRFFFQKGAANSQIQNIDDEINRINISELSSNCKKDKKKIIDPVQILITKAHKIYLPKLRYEHSSNQAQSVQQQNKTIQYTKLPLSKSIETQETDFYIDSEDVLPIYKLLRPKKTNSELYNGTAKSTLQSRSNFLSESHTYIEFNDKTIVYKISNSHSVISNNAYRYRESSNQKTFIAVSNELNIDLYNWDLKLLGTFYAADFPEKNNHLRCLDLSSDLSCFLFTVVDKAFLLDSNMNLLSAWYVPTKDGFERMINLIQPKEENRLVNEYLEILEVTDKPTKSEVKQAFRKMILKWHPDRNPNNPEAEERTRSLIEAYEYLSGEDVLSAFDISERNEYKWVTTGRTTKLQSDGIQLEMTIYGLGEDWIYGTGISDDGLRIYFGCYSGKIYQINQKGIAEKIYIMPYDTSGEYEISNPILFVTEFNERLYILTRWYLYILKDDKLIQYIKNEKGNYRNNEKANYKWFKNGFIHQDKKEIILFDRDGRRTGIITFKSPIIQVCYKEKILLVSPQLKRSHLVSGNYKSMLKQESM